MNAQYQPRDPGKKRFFQCGTFLLECIATKSSTTILLIDQFLVLKTLHNMFPFIGFFGSIYYTWSTVFIIERCRWIDMEKPTFKSGRVVFCPAILYSVSVIKVWVYWSVGSAARVTARFPYKFSPFSYPYKRTPPLHKGRIFSITSRLFSTTSPTSLLRILKRQ